MAISYNLNEVRPAFNQSPVGASINNGTINVDGRELSVRTLAHDGLGDCLDFFKSIPHMIMNFFAHLYADTRMFIKAVTSIGCGTTSNDVELRAQHLYELHVVARQSAATIREHNELRDKFMSLSSSEQSLLFFVDHNYLQRLLQRPIDVDVSREIRDEVARESHRAMFFQNALSPVNNFLNWITGSCGNSGAATTIPATTIPATTIPSSGVTNPNSIPAPTGPSILNGIHLNIPGTLPFDPNQIIPQEVQTKADEIVRLRGLFDAMDENNRPALPAGYECPISLSIISIPVFDASHPAVQAAFLPGATVALNNRDNRHPIDLNEYIRNGTVGLNNDRCSICRHQPALHRNAAFNPYMRIDSALQDEILQFLRAVPGINNAATTT